MENAKETLGKKKYVTSSTVLVKFKYNNKSCTRSLIYVCNCVSIDVYYIIIQLIVCGLIGRLAFSKAVEMDPRMKLLKDYENVRKEYLSNTEEKLVNRIL